jgi:hypothetical protein
LRERERERENAPKRHCQITHRRLTKIYDGFFFL